VIAEVTPFEVAFRSSVRDATAVRSERRGAVLSLSDGGRRGQGELAPLPGRSPEALEAGCLALEQLEASALPTAEELGAGGWLDAIRRASARLPAELGAARHALETALLDLCGALHRAPAPVLLARALGTTPPAGRLPVAALVDAQDPSEALRQAEAAAARGIRTLKLKIAGDESDQAILERVRRLSRDFGLRLDANGSLSREQCARLMPRLSEANVEFLEEPLPFDQLPAEVPPLPLAADEALLSSDFTLARARQRGITVLVLKPMLLGFVRTLELARAASAAGLEIVLSHAFDGPRAMAASRALGLALGGRRYADGLAAHAALEVWPEPLPGHVTAPFLEAWTSPGLGVP